MTESAVRSVPAGPGQRWRAPARESGQRERAGPRDTGPEESGALRRDGYSGPFLLSGGHPRRRRTPSVRSRDGRRRGPGRPRPPASARRGRRSRTSRWQSSRARLRQDRVLTRRIAWMAVKARRSPALLAVTFTRNAASELVSARPARRATRGHRGHFHALALAQLRGRAADPAASAHAARSQGPDPRADPGRRGPEAGRGVRARRRDRVGQGPARRRRLRATRTRRRSVLNRPAARARRALLRYEKEKRRRRLVDFDDLSVVADAMENDADSPPRSAGDSATCSSTSSRTSAPRSCSCSALARRTPAS